MCASLRKKGDLLEWYIYIDQNQKANWNRDWRLSVPLLFSHSWLALLSIFLHLKSGKTSFWLHTGKHQCPLCQTTLMGSHSGYRWLPFCWVPISAPTHGHSCTKNRNSALGTTEANTGYGSHETGSVYLPSNLYSFPATGLSPLL